MKEMQDDFDVIRSLYMTDDFKRFFGDLDERTKDKFKQIFDIIQTVYVLSARFVEKLENSDCYEMRVSVGYNEYRTILFAIDHDNIIQSTKIILLNGFLKKSTKDYDKQIKKAERILKELEL